MFNKKQNIISAVIVSIIIGFSMYLYRYNVSYELDIGNKQMLYEISSQQKLSLEMNINEKTDSLNSLASIAGSLISENSISNFSSEITDIFSELESSILFDNLIIAQLNGDAILSNGATLNISDFDFFKDAIQHDSSMSSLINSPITNTNSIFLSSAIYNNLGEKIGILFGEIKPETLQADLNTIFSGEGVYIIIENDGTIISSTSKTSSLLSGENIKYYDDISIFDKKQPYTSFVDILESTSLVGTANYTLDDQEKTLTFFDIDNTNWKLLMTIPNSVISKTSNAIILNTILISTEVVVILLSVLFSTLKIHKRYTTNLEKIAYYDKLTGLFNETKFKQKVKQILRKNTETSYIIVKMDIINFKVINELYDYNIGDSILKIISEGLKTVANDKFIVAKGDEDEFLLFSSIDLLNKLFDENSNYEDLINRGISTICPRELKFRYSRYNIPTGSTNIDEIISTLTLTHNHHKKIGFAKNKFYDYEETLKKDLIHTAYICDIMRDALKNNEFQVYLQPKNNIKTKAICGAEALVRWKRPDGSFIYPNDFIPIFEQEGFIVELDKYMLSNVCGIIKRFLLQGYRIPISINFSRLHMLNKNFTLELKEITDSFGIPHELIEIEMTETSMMEDIESFKNLSLDLHNKGFSLSIDDFGAGYSSFDLLSDLDFDILKIDKSLLAEAHHSQKRQLVLKTIVDMAKNLSLKSVCEGVETAEQLKILEDMGCDIAQGYFFSKPIPNEEFDSLLNF